MLGKTLYSNPFAALSELIANGFDAYADKAWVYIDIRDKRKSKMVVLDNGKGMTDSDVIDKYLQVGKKNRPEDDNEMMGRKGIGKLAAFYLSNTYCIATKTKTELNMYEIDFSLHEKGDREETDDEYMKKIESVSFFDEEIRRSFSENKTGTAIILDNVNLLGYGEKSFDVLESELAELFCNPNKKILLKLVRNNDQEADSFIPVKRKIAFLNMSKILYTVDDRDKVKAYDGIEIKNTENDSNELDNRIQTEVINIDIPKVQIKEKKIDLSPRGWIGIHQTINRELASQNDPENFINSRFYHFNKVRIYVRGKLALENILPYVHNTQYYVNYIEGNIECDVLDQNDLPDIASSSRQDIDKNDPRFVQLVKYVDDLVKQLVHFKNEQTRKNKEKKDTRQRNAVKTLTSEVKSILNSKIGTSIQNSDVEDVSHTIANSFEQVSSLIKTKYVLFLSHKRGSNRFADFLYFYLREVCCFEDSIIFYTSKPGGIDQSVEILEAQINKTLIDENSYVVFCIESKEFMKSQYCMFEGGAAWAVKQNSVIGLAYNDYSKDVPVYLKSLRNRSIDLSKKELDRDSYTGLVNLLNSIIDYLNNNYVEDGQKKNRIELNLPSDVELTTKATTIDAYFNKELIQYWDRYIKLRG